MVSVLLSGKTRLTGRPPLLDIRYGFQKKFFFQKYSDFKYFKGVDVGLGLLRNLLLFTERGHLIHSFFFASKRFRTTEPTFPYFNLNLSEISFVSRREKYAALSPAEDGDIWQLELTSYTGSYEISFAQYGKHSSASFRQLAIWCSGSWQIFLPVFPVQWLIHCSVNDLVSFKYLKLCEQLLDWVIWWNTQKPELNR